MNPASLYSDAPPLLNCFVWLYHTERLKGIFLVRARFAASLRFENGAYCEFYGKVYRRGWGWQVRVSPPLPDALYDRVREEVIARAEAGERPFAWERRMPS